MINVPSTVYQLLPKSERAQEWIDEHVQYEAHNMLGKSIVVEWRYLDPIVEGMLRDGLTVDEDFEVLDGF